MLTIFIAITYAVFNYNAVCHSNAISDMLQIIHSTSDIGSFDWVLILIWDIALFLYFTFNALGAFYCFRQTFFKKHQILSIAIILLAVLVLSLLSSFDIYSGILFAQNIMCYFVVIPQYLLPILIFIFSFKLKRRKNDKVYLEK